jgi:hypothetical protein
MRIDDRQFWLEDRFFAPVEPIPPNWVRWRSLLLRVRAPRKATGRRRTE